VGTYLGYELIWAEVLLGQLLSGSLDAEVLFFDIGTLSEGEVWGWHSTSVSSCSESLLSLSHLGLEIFVELT